MYSVLECAKSCILSYQADQVSPFPDEEVSRDLVNTQVYNIDICTLFTPWCSEVDTHDLSSVVHYLCVMINM